MGAFRVLIPVNRLDRAKGRLADLLTPAQRAELALATLGTVLDAVAEAGGEAFVLTSDSRAMAAAEARATVLEEREGRDGLNAQLEAAVAALGGEELLILHADLPLASGEALRALMAGAPAAPSVTLVESGDGGTNAMLLRPPGRFALCYGRGSAAAHRAAAGEAGMTVVTPGAALLALDLDTPADIEDLLARPGGPECAAGQLLRAWESAR